MKNLIIIAIIILSSSTMFAQKTASDYVATKDGITFYENLNYGVFNFITAKSNDEKTKYDKKDVLEYRKDGHVYTKLPIIIDNTPIGKYVFMKAIAYRNGLILYEQKRFDCNGNECKNYYIFKNKSFVVDINNLNIKSLLSFFEKSDSDNTES